MNAKQNVQMLENYIAYIFTEDQTRSAIKFFDDYIEDVNHLKSTNVSLVEALEGICKPFQKDLGTDPMGWHNELRDKLLIANHALSLAKGEK